MAATKYVFITGGVVSSLGKGITAASLGRLLKNRGIGVVNQKIDPYINVDPANMSPTQHGEVFVTEDGTETDLALGHYERFTDSVLPGCCSTTIGAVYDRVVRSEREGKYLGGTVQVIPHVTNEVKAALRTAAAQLHPDVVIAEVGGTVGDIESLPVIEAIRQMRRDLGSENVMYIHVTLVPFLAASAEAKTKPTQHSVKELRSIGIQPNAIVCRSERPLSKDTEAKVALFCDIEPEAVIQLPDTDNLYEIPLILREQGLDDIVVNYFRLECGSAKMEEWEAMVRRAKNPKDKVKIGIVGKYTELQDSYLSVSEALRHAGIFHQAAVEIRLIFSGDIDSEEKAGEILAGLHGILVPGGFGSRGIEGKILAIQYARERQIPYFGIGLGMQLAMVEYGRHVLGLDAGSEEAHPGRKDLVAHYARKEDCGDHSTFGKNGSMRLGSYGCALQSNSRAGRAYGGGMIRERHRHRLEFNNAYRQVFAAGGVLFSGCSEDGEFVEVAELPDHPWFVACSYQPEFKSRPNRAHPLFRDFVGAALAAKNGLAFGGG
ncbi:MAG: CTP synthase [Peptococcaceae bacterium]|jgi:CTP synthase|nr:CTP synthase [Peptococcaceae bacterium]